MELSSCSRRRPTSARTRASLPLFCSDLAVRSSEESREGQEGGKRSGGVTGGPIDTSPADELGTPPLESSASFGFRCGVCRLKITLGPKIDQCYFASNSKHPTSARWETNTHTLFEHTRCHRWRFRRQSTSSATGYAALSYGSRSRCSYFEDRAIHPTGRRI